MEMTKYAVGVDIGGTNVRVCLGDENGNVKDKLSEKLDVEDKNSVTKQIVRMINSLKSDFSAIGIGSIGLLDLKKGELSNPVHIPFKNIPIVKQLKGVFDVPTYLVNDCDAGVIGEKSFGLGKKEENLAYLTISTGIGCGVVLNGKLILGKDGNATEVGHLTIDLNSKLKCGCGGYGHWEAYCSGRTIPNFVRLLGKNDTRLKNSLILKLCNGNIANLTSEKFFEAVKLKDELSLEILEKIGEVNAIGISNINAAYDVSLITIGGSVALKNENFILNPIIKNLSKHSLNRIPKVAITQLGEDVVLYGALAVAFDSSILE
ncbi:MAG: ROK family protein [Candidatus Aenigmarchaeota archaeon]|nr:ROK family protein [Candidatus Aenigmarchaeota archaeon]